MSVNRVCPFCKQSFQPSRYRPEQKVCSSEKCQAQRRSEYHRSKMERDPAYSRQCRDSQRQWREGNKAHLKRYRQQRRHQSAEAAQDLASSRRKRLLELLKQGSVYDVRQYKTELWIVCTSGGAELENILADAKFLILQVELSCSLSKS